MVFVMKVPRWRYIKANSDNFREFAVNLERTAKTVSFTIYLLNSFFVFVLRDIA